MCIFIPWTAGVNMLSGVRESGLGDEHAAMAGLPMGTPWLLMSDDASVFCARKKRVNNNYLYGT
jgi:hypothetical protein